MSTSNNNATTPAPPACTAPGCTCGQVLANLVRMLGYSSEVISCNNPKCNNTGTRFSMNGCAHEYPADWRQAACSCSSKVFQYCCEDCKNAVQPADRRCQHCDKPHGRGFNKYD